MRFQFCAGATERPVISVDGTLPHGPNFSHWPGNRTPRDLVRDTSTGIALALAALPPADRASRLANLDVVANNHFDTDGVLSCYALMHPEFALAHREAFLAAATCGDFQVMTTASALALDLAIAWLGSDDGPNGARLQAATGSTRGQLQYEIAFEALPRLLDDACREVPAIEAELDATLADVAAARGEARVETIPELSLAVVEHERELRRVAVNTVAGARQRVLTVTPRSDGTLFRYFERVESWFEMATVRPVDRLDLAALAEYLDRIEPAASRVGGAKWRADDPHSPVPEVGFGVEGTGPSFGPSTPADLRPSALPIAAVVHAIREIAASRKESD